jgi:Amt family ammonium transporter
MFIDMFATGKPSMLGAVNGMITGLVAITPAAGYVNGLGAIIIGVVAAAIPWFTMNKVAIFRKVDDALGVVHTHGIAGLVGGLMVGVVGDPHMIVYFGIKAQQTSDVSVGGFLYGAGFHQLEVQAIAALFVIAYNIVATTILAKVVSIFIPLRLSDAELEAGDLAVHGEEVGYVSPVDGAEPVAAR